MFFATFIAKLADVSVTPNSNLPGTSTLQGLVGGLETWLLYGCIAAAMTGAVVWAVSSRTGNYSGTHGGRSTVVIAIVAAMLIGGSSILVNWAFGLGGGI